MVTCDVLSEDQAPGRLSLVQALANSYDLRLGRDEFATAEEATDWLLAHGLMQRGGRIGGAELTLLHEFRAALRALLLANNGAPSADRDNEIVNRAIRDSGLRLRIGHGGALDLEVPSDGFEGALGRLMAIVCDAVISGGWRRLKACPEDACNYAFYDRSTNNSRTWCDMARCGSRVKMRSYRARIKRSSPES